MKIYITREDIWTALSLNFLPGKSRASICPLACSLKRLGLEDVCVGFHFNNKRWMSFRPAIDLSAVILELPDEAVKFIEHADKLKDFIEPTELELPLEDYLSAEPVLPTE